jgi:Fe-S-cluster containining protein
MDEKEIIKAEKMLKEARNSISQFCIDECRAYCCRKGVLTLNAKESNDFMKNIPKNIPGSAKVSHAANGDSVVLLNESGCPNLDKNCLCTIHTKKNRPTICKEFPILIKNHTVLFCQDCPAVEQKKFYAYEAKLIKKGFNCMYF